MAVIFARITTSALCVSAPLCNPISQLPSQISSESAQPPSVSQLSKQQQMQQALWYACRDRLTTSTVQSSVVVATIVIRLSYRVYAKQL